MKTTSHRTERRVGAAFWAVLWGLHAVLGPATPAWAQRRRAEPEANPQFQQQMQRPQGGGPVGGAAPDMEPDMGADPGMDAAPRGRRPRIGAARDDAAPPPPPANPLDTRIVVRVKNAPLATFLDTISAQAKVNFIITEGLEQKRVTAFLQNVTVREALQILLEIKGLTYQRIGKSNTYVVSKRTSGEPNRITRIYTLNYIPLVPIGAGAQFGAGGGGEAAAAAPPAEGAAPPGASGGTDTTGGSGGEIAILNVVKSVLSKKYGRIAVDARTNSIIITDVPEVFPQVEQILAELDRKAPQVMIEAQIVEINSDRGQQLGLEWGGTTGEMGSYYGPQRDSTFPLNLPRELTNTHFFDPVTNVVSALGGGGESDSSSEDDTSSTTDVTVGSNLKTGLLDLTSLRVVLRALVTRAEARFLGKPKILTINNKAAVIEVESDEATSLQQSQSSGDGLTTAGTQVERQKTGLKLSVLPQVNQEGYITMLVKPQFTNVSDSVYTSLGQPVKDTNKRQAQTLVRVKNGQTLVLGGLLSSRETKSVRKVPFLGYIPLIGWLFTSVSNRRENTDLVIFITPTIVTD